MSKIHETIEYVFQQNPWCLESNTNACIAVWEEVARRRGVDVDDWVEMKAIMRDKNWKPESITRARRYYSDSTQQQREKEQEFFQTYA